MRWRSWGVGACFLGLVGILFSVAGPNFIAALVARTWSATPCVILKSEVVEVPFSPTVMHFELNVEYTYSFQGRKYHSTRFTSGDRQGSTDASVAERAAMRFGAGANATCYVNPRDPAEAVLERGELWGGLIVLSPLLIFGLVFHESIFDWFERRRGRERHTRNPPMSDVNEALQSDGRATMLGVIGLVMGVFFLGFGVVAPLWYWIKSRDWTQVTATITRCQISSHSTQHGPEYKLELLYEYEVDGRRFHSNRKVFGLPFDQPVADLSVWVAAHPASTSIPCFVDPANPTEAVLQRNPIINWIAPALGGLMLLLAVLMFGANLERWWMRRNLVGKKLTEYCLGKPMPGTRCLRVSPPPFWMAIASGAGALALVPPAAWSLQKGVRAMMGGQADVINLAYGALATAGVIGLMVQCWKFALKAWRPRPVLRITPGTPSPGGEFRIEWQFPKTNPVRSLRIVMEGKEEAKVRIVQGSLHGAMSEIKTISSPFLTLPIAEAGELQRSGQATVRLPGTVMHSFRGARCAVTWQIKVSYDCNGGKAMEYTFPITLRPGTWQGTS